jgi:hypothetical protein
LRWLLDLLEPRPIAGGANNFDHLTLLFHGDLVKESKYCINFARR